jgi:hypothetical protein
VLDLQGFLHHLHRLASSCDGDLGELAEHIADVTEMLEQAVPGSAGLQLTVVQAGLPVTLDATPLITEGDPAATSLGVPLPLLSPAFEPGGRVVFYSTVPGALVDLAVDLARLLSRTDAAAVELDADLPLVHGGPPLTGLDDVVTVNRALGVLIDQGQRPDEAHQALHDRAAAHGLTPLALARRLLARRLLGRRPF